MGFFTRKARKTADDGDKPVYKRANLGGANTMYYNEELKCWVERGKEEEVRKEQQRLAAPPPMPTASSSAAASTSTAGPSTSAGPSTDAPPPRPPPNMSRSRDLSSRYVNVMASSTSTATSDAPSRPLVPGMPSLLPGAPGSFPAAPGGSAFPRPFMPAMPASSSAPSFFMPSAPSTSAAAGQGDTEGPASVPGMPAANGITPSLFMPTAKAASTPSANEQSGADSSTAQPPKSGTPLANGAAPAFFMPSANGMAESQPQQQQQQQQQGESTATSSQPHVSHHSMPSFTSWRPHASGDNQQQQGAEQQQQQQQQQDEGEASDATSPAQDTFATRRTSRASGSSPTHAHSNGQANGYHHGFVDGAAGAYSAADTEGASLPHTDAYGYANGHSHAYGNNPAGGDYSTGFDPEGVADSTAFGADGTIGAANGFVHGLDAGADSFGHGFEVGMQNGAGAEVYGSNMGAVPQADAAVNAFSGSAGGYVPAQNGSAFAADPEGGDLDWAMAAAPEPAAPVTSSPRHSNDTAPAHTHAAGGDAHTPTHASHGMFMPGASMALPVQPQGQLQSQRSGGTFSPTGFPQPHAPQHSASMFMPSAATALPLQPQGQLQSQRSGGAFSPTMGSPRNQAPLQSQRSGGTFSPTGFPQPHAQQHSASMFMPAAPGSFGQQQQQQQQQGGALYMPQGRSPPQSPPAAYGVPSARSPSHGGSRVNSPPANFFMPAPPAAPAGNMFMPTSQQQQPQSFFMPQPATGAVQSPRAARSPTSPAANGFAADGAEDANGHHFLGRNTINGNAPNHYGANGFASNQYTANAYGPAGSHAANGFGAHDSLANGAGPSNGMALQPPQRTSPDTDTGGRQGADDSNAPIPWQDPRTQTDPYDRWILEQAQKVDWTRHKFKTPGKINKLLPWEEFEAEQRAKRDKDNPPPEVPLEDRFWVQHMRREGREPLSITRARRAQSEPANGAQQASPGASDSRMSDGSCYGGMAGHQASSYQAGSYQGGYQNGSYGGSYQDGGYQNGTYQPGVEGGGAAVAGMQDAGPEQQGSYGQYSGQYGAADGQQGFGYGDGVAQDLYAQQQWGNEQWGQQGEQATTPTSRMQAQQADDPEGAAAVAIGVGIEVVAAESSALPMSLAGGDVGAAANSNDGVPGDGLFVQQEHQQQDWQQQGWQADDWQQQVDESAAAVMEVDIAYLEEANSNSGMPDAEGAGVSYEAQRRSSDGALLNEACAHEQQPTSIPSPTSLQQQQQQGQPWSPRAAATTVGAEWLRLKTAIGSLASSATGSWWVQLGDTLFANTSLAGSPAAALGDGPSSNDALINMEESLPEKVLEEIGQCQLKNDLQSAAFAHLNFNLDLIFDTI